MNTGVVIILVYIFAAAGFHYARIVRTPRSPWAHHGLTEKNIKLSRYFSGFT